MAGRVSLSGRLGDPGVALSGAGEGVENADAVAGGGGDVRADGAEGLRAGHRAHAAGNLDAELSERAWPARLRMAACWNSPGSASLVPLGPRPAPATPPPVPAAHRAARPAPAGARCAHPARPAAPATARSPCATRRSPHQARQPHQARRAYRTQAARCQSRPFVSNTTLQAGPSREFTTGSQLRWYLTRYGKGSPGAPERHRHGARLPG